MTFGEGLVYIVVALIIGQSLCSLGTNIANGILKGLQKIAKSIEHLNDKR